VRVGALVYVLMSVPSLVAAWLLAPSPGSSGGAKSIPVDIDDEKQQLLGGSGTARGSAAATPEPPHGHAPQTPARPIPQSSSRSQAANHGADHEHGNGLCTRLLAASVRTPSPGPSSPGGSRCSTPRSTAALLGTAHALDGGAPEGAMGAHSPPSLGSPLGLCSPIPAAAGAAAGKSAEQGQQQEAAGSRVAAACKGDDAALDPQQRVDVEVVVKLKLPSQSRRALFGAAAPRHHDSATSETAALLGEHGGGDSAGVKGGEGKAAADSGSGAGAAAGKAADTAADAKHARSLSSEEEAGVTIGSLLLKPGVATFMLRALVIGFGLGAQGSFASLLVMQLPRGSELLMGLMLVVSCWWLLVRVGLGWFGWGTGLKGGVQI